MNSVLVLHLTRNPRRYILLHELRSNDSNKGGVGTVSSGTSTESLSGSGGSVEQHSLRRINTEVDEPLRLKQWQFDDLSKLLNLFFASSHIAIGDIGLLLDLHHRHRGVNLGWQWDLNMIFGAVHSIFIRDTKI